MISDNLRMKSRKVALNRRASNVRRARPNAIGVTSYQPSINKQIRALIAGRQKDATDANRDRTAYTTTASGCLTATNGMTGVADSASGLLACDSDEVLINSVRLKGYHENTASLDVNPDGNRDTFIRHLVVWFYKPLLVASAAGTLPPITEVLVSDELHSLPVTSVANGGRFVVLSDRMWNVGTNTYQAITAVGSAINTGKSKQYFDYTVKVGKSVKFSLPSTVGAAQGGHYDSDSPQGLVDRGLLVFYSQVAIGNNSSVNTVCDSRLNYTG